jgi:hypothetical protein
MKLKLLAKSVFSDLTKKAGADINALITKQKENVQTAIMNTKPAQEFKAAETKRTINAYLPFIILGALILVYLGYRSK